MPHRRTVLGAGLALAAPAARAAPAGDPLAGAALYADVVRYAAFGDHRTATEADHRTSRWLADELTAAGLKARLSPWAHQQFHIRAQRLQVAGEVVDSFPLWWPAPTGPQPLAAPLRRLSEPGDLAGAIAFAGVDRVRGTSIRPGGEVGTLVDAAAGRKAAGLVLVTRDPAGEVVALNAMSGLSRWPIPVLCAGGRDEPRLTAAAERGAPAELLIDGRYDYAAKAYEVIGTLGGGPRTVVVSTPSSGWFACAGERGPGIALWLALARWAARARRPERFVFVASSGHEMESVGIRHFVGHDAPPPGDVTSWLHLGAGIATYAYDFAGGTPRRLPGANPARRLMTNDAALMPVLERRFADLRGLKPILGARPGGEMLLMANQGYKVWGFAGGSAFHHMRSDVPDKITGPELLEPVARATVAALEDMLGVDSPPP